MPQNASDTWLKPNCLSEVVGLAVRRPWRAGPYRHSSQWSAYLTCMLCALASHEGACCAAPFQPHICKTCTDAQWIWIQVDMIKHSTKTKTVENLERKDCRWPIGDPRHGNFHFCGAQQAIGRPYCQHHWDMSYNPSRSRQQPNVPVLPIKLAA